MKYAIRRNLGNKFKGFWQISECPTNSKIGKLIGFIDGTKQSIIMSECLLYNSLGTSEKIYKGRNLDKKVHKERCAWIVCDSYEITDIINVNNDIEISFNPRKSPHFISEGKNVDKTKHEILFSSDYKIYK
mgnify:CR=1 FL=1|tara:strand:- start:131 stop:523 length:393 start_codon:yes stop_codon:yes gene_type:complete